jgi:hypothetical protein
LKKEVVREKGSEGEVLRERYLEKEEREIGSYRKMKGERER